VLPLVASVMPSCDSLTTTSHDAAVLSVGQGFLGCLGHNSFDDCAVPTRLVEEGLAKPKQVAAGW
jgi:hypothetical protein